MLKDHPQQLTTQAACEQRLYFLLCQLSSLTLDSQKYAQRIVEIEAEIALVQAVIRSIGEAIPHNHQKKL